MKKKDRTIKRKKIYSMKKEKYQVLQKQLRDRGSKNFYKDKHRRPN